MTVADIFIFSLGFLVACVLALIVSRMVWVRAVRITRARLERDRPETLRTFEARIAGAQARAAVSIRELERSLERERQISAQARLMADQMTSSSTIASAERDDTQAALVNLSDTLEQTRERLREQEELVTRRATEIANLRRDISDIRQELAMRDEDVRRSEAEADGLRVELAAQLGADQDPRELAQLSKTEGATAIARRQIEDLREELRVLRSEKNAAEASAARARLLLDARDDSAAVEAERQAFNAEREALTARIDELEGEMKRPRLVAVSGSETASGDPEALRDLRQSIDAMTASLTASAAVETGASSRINQLLDEAEDQAGEGALVTSLVEARERLRSKQNPPSQDDSAAQDDASSPAAAAKQAAAKLAARKPRTRSTKAAATSKTGTSAKPATKIKATAAAGKATKAKAPSAPSDSSEERPQRTGLPRASESDLKVI